MSAQEGEERLLTVYKPPSRNINLNLCIDLTQLCRCPLLLQPPYTSADSASLR